MSDPSWYYSEGERQKGPVSADDLKRLVELGRVKPTDLVWQPGMDDWVPAKSIRGLVPDDLQVDSASEAGAARIDGGFEDDLDILARRRRRRSSFRLDGELLNRWGGRYAKLLVLVGLIAVVVGRGCDSIGSKFARRQQVLLDLAKAEMDLGYRKNRSEIETRLNELQQNTATSEADAALIAQYREQLSRIDVNYANQQSELSRTKWMDMDIEARAAVSKHQAWQPYYELAAMIGSIVLAVGLLSVAFTGEPIERWGSWILLGVILASLLIWRTVP